MLFSFSPFSWKEILVVLNANSWKPKTEFCSSFHPKTPTMIKIARSTDLHYNLLFYRTKPVTLSCHLLSVLCFLGKQSSGFQIFPLINKKRHKKICKNFTRSDGCLRYEQKSKKTWWLDYMIVLLVKIEL